MGRIREWDLPRKRRPQRGRVRVVVVGHVHGPVHPPPLHQLEGDAALPVRGLGPAAFAECLLALRTAAAWAVALLLVFPLAWLFLTAFKTALQAIAVPPLL